MNVLKELKYHKACEEGLLWVESQKDQSPESLFKEAMREKKYTDLNWVISRLLKTEDKIRYAIFAARLVLHIFEEKYPKDKRPRLAIEAAENYLKNPTEENKYAATYAAYAAADAAYAAYAAATYSANAAGDAATSVRIKVLNYGFKLLMKGGKQ